LLEHAALVQALSANRSDQGTNKRSPTFRIEASDRRKREDFESSYDWDGRRRDKPNKVCYVVSRQTMKYELFTRLTLKTDLPQHGLRSGDVATSVEHHVGRPDREPVYTLEVFNAVGQTIAVVTVRESEIEPLKPNELLHVRPLARVVR
jgi:hypothetical protein